MTERMLRLAVDVGGTFTDVTLADAAPGRLISAKVPTTPRDRALGILEGIAAALDMAGERAERVAEVVHGSTTGTNALIERTGAKVGLLTTEGFRDVLEIGRIMRPDAGLYDSRSTGRSRSCRVICAARRASESTHRAACCCRSTRRRCARRPSTSRTSASRRSRCVSCSPSSIPRTRTWPSASSPSACPACRSAYRRACVRRSANTSGPRPR